MLNSNDFVRLADFAGKRRARLVAHRDDDRGFSSPPRLPPLVPGMVAVLPGAAGTVPVVLVCVRLNSPPSTVLCQLTAPSWYQ